MVYQTFRQCQRAVHAHLAFDVVEQGVATGLNLPLWFMARPQQGP